MKSISRIPALFCQPLVESTAPPAIVKAAPPGPSVGFISRLITRLVGRILRRVPVGFEDETGFHFGAPAIPPAAVPPRRLSTRLEGRHPRAGIPTLRFSKCRIPPWPAGPIRNPIPPPIPVRVNRRVRTFRRKPF